MFESLIQVLHQLALNALGLVLTLLSGSLPASEPSHAPASEASPRHGAALMLHEGGRYSQGTCGARSAQLQLIALDHHA
jgi:hypothetical protein